MSRWRETETKTAVTVKRDRDRRKRYVGERQVVTHVKVLLREYASNPYGILRF